MQIKHERTLGLLSPILSIIPYHRQIPVVEAPFVSTILYDVPHLTVSGHIERIQSWNRLGRVSKIDSSPVDNLVPILQAKERRRGERSVSRTDRSCHLYEETQHSVSGRLKWQAWRDSRRGTNRPDRTAKKVSSTRCDRKRRRRRATSDYSRPPRSRKKAAIASKRPSRPRREMRAWESAAGWC